MDKKWVVHFRRIAPEDSHTPMMYLPRQVWGGLRAETPEGAWREFLSNFPIGERDWYRQEGTPEVQD